MLGSSMKKQMQKKLPIFTVLFIHLCQKQSEIKKLEENFKFGHKMYFICLIIVSPKTPNETVFTLNACSLNNVLHITIAKLLCSILKMSCWDLNVTILISQNHAGAGKVESSLLASFHCLRRQLEEKTCQEKWQKLDQTPKILFQV